MRSVNLALTVVLAATAAGAARADMIWDNFLSSNPASDGGFDGRSYFSSERNASVVDSWTADDAVWTQSVTVQGVKWAGGRDARFPYGTVELIVLKEVDGVLSTVQQYSLGQPTVTGTFGTFQGFQVYDGYVDLPGGGLGLTAGHYYFGIRLVNGVNGDADGRNVFMTTGTIGGQTTINGLTMGMFQSDFFGYPNWTLTADTSAHMTTDFAFQVYGILPEPASLMLLAAGLLVARRR
jgi:hypothetical protein